MLAFLVVQNIVAGTGIIFGFPSLAVMLLSEGQYSYLCTTEDPPPCQAQQQRIVRVFIIGQAALGAGMFCNGRLLDRFGPRKVAVGCLSLQGAGLLLLTFADSRFFDVLDIACLLLGLGGSGLHLSAFHVAALFPRQTRGTVTSFLVGAFIFSGVVWLVWTTIVVSWGSTRLVVGAAHSALILLIILPAGAALQPPRRFREGDILTFRGPLLRLREAPFDVLPKEGTGASGGGGDALPAPALTPTAPQGPKYLSAKFFGILLFFGSHYINFAFLVGVWCARLPCAYCRLRRPFAPRPFSYLPLHYYVLCVMAACRARWRRASKLSAMGDDEGVYARILTLAMPLFALVVPVIGQLIDRCGLPATFGVVALLGVAYDALVISKTSLGWLVIVTIALFAFFRVLLFSAMFQYIAKHFGLAHFGRVSGLVIATSSAAAFIFGFVAPYLGGSPHWGGVFTFYAILSGITIVFAAYVRALEAGK